MNRQYFFNFVEQQLSTLVTSTELRGKLNILDLNIHSENFYLNFFNLLFDWKLQNLNAVIQNVEGIDLVDNKNSIIVQVSSTATKDKINAALSKDLTKYNGYRFKFISICKDADNLRSKTYKCPQNIAFDPKLDIYDIKYVLNIILNLDIQNLEHIYIFIKKELNTNIDLVKIHTNLASVINILAQENLGQDIEDYTIKPFEIDRKIEFNNLRNAKDVIRDYAIHYPKVDKIYTEFNINGINKSVSVLASIRDCYTKNKAIINDNDLFFKVIELVKEKVQGSSNYTEMPYDELELCINILVVDAFVRCKIFENPEEYSYATS